ncbi:AlpA family phage regulatory protein [Aquihabitans sp. G128]|uniref:AlpA family phage regulatory protein n=1 Tax=Aquihabitans sp. G128 TaxID=2849779 RepID=UPI001C239D0C|nr:AlpA family phage regulatory protein [Aquihabitans sp. G128]QXC61630.1 AlpA family phage regulatory protein [Aquihabitans sp. G128]
MKLGRTAARTALSSAGAPVPVRLSKRTVLWHRSELIAWLRSFQSTPSNSVEGAELMSFREVASMVGLSRTAAREALARPNGPCPVRLNARAVRYWDTDIAMWLETRRNPALGRTSAPSPARRVGGRPRKAIV